MEGKTKKIKSSTHQIEWRKPNKISGKLITGIIQRLKAHQNIDKAYLTEIKNLNHDTDFIPLIAIEARSTISGESAIKEICNFLSEFEDLDTAINLCLSQELPHLEVALKEGKARIFYEPSK